MHVRSWSFTNLSGLTTPPSILSGETSTDVRWLEPSNEIVVEGVFPTGDETHQVVLENMIIEDGEITIIICINKVDSEIVSDVGRNVPYQVTLELMSGFPERLTIIHKNERSEEVHSKTVANPG